MDLGPETHMLAPHRWPGAAAGESGRLSKRVSRSKSLLCFIGSVSPRVRLIFVSPGPKPSSGFSAMKKWSFKLHLTKLIKSMPPRRTLCKL